MRSVEALRSLRCFKAASVASSSPQDLTTSFSSLSTVGWETGRVRTLFRADRMSMKSVLGHNEPLFRIRQGDLGLEHVIVSDHPELVLVLGDLRDGP